VAEEHGLARPGAGRSYGLCQGEVSCQSRGERTLEGGIPPGRARDIFKDAHRGVRLNGGFAAVARGRLGFLPAGPLPGGTGQPRSPGALST